MKEESEYAYLNELKVSLVNERFTTELVFSIDEDSEGNPMVCVNGYQQGGGVFWMEYLNVQQVKLIVAFLSTVK